MRVIFTRHGETEENVAHMTQGQKFGGTLNEVGIAQAKKLGQRLSGEKITHIYASDLKRVVDTSQEITPHHPQAQFMLSPAIRERNLGIYEGQHSDVWKQVMAQSAEPYHAFTPQEGESYQDLYNRMSAFWQELKQTHQENDTVLVISHGGALTMLFLHLFGRPVTLEEYLAHKPENTAVTICEVAPDGTITTEVLNSTDHLVG